MSKVIAFEKKEEKKEKKKSKDMGVSYTQIMRYNSDGELVSECTFNQRTQNGSGFVLSYTEQMNDFVIKCDKLTVLRLFMYLSHNQQYGNNGVYGCRCTRKHLQQVLGVDRKSIYNALSELKSKFLVNEIRINGCLEFMVNPNYITVGKEKKDRMREWNLRWAKCLAINASSGTYTIPDIRGKVDHPEEEDDDDDDN